MTRKMQIDTTGPFPHPFLAYPLPAEKTALRSEEERIGLKWKQVTPGCAGAATDGSCLKLGDQRKVWLSRGVGWWGCSHLGAHALGCMAHRKWQQGSSCHRAAVSSEVSGSSCKKSPEVNCRRERAVSWRRIRMKQEGPCQG